jgi:hypothetical protein
MQYFSIFLETSQQIFGITNVRLGLERIIIEGICIDFSILIKLKFLKNTKKHWNDIDYFSVLYYCVFDENHLIIYEERIFN